MTTVEANGVTLGAEHFGERGRSCSSTMTSGSWLSIPGMCPHGEQLFELVEALSPTVAVKGTARLGLERALGEGNLRRAVQVRQKGSPSGGCIWIR
jgi:hypothetical protein